MARNRTRKASKSRMVSGEEGLMEGGRRRRRSRKRRSRKRTKKKRKGKKRGMNAFFKLMLAAKKKKAKSFLYKGKTYVGKVHARLGMIYKKK